MNHLLLILAFLLSTPPAVGSASTLTPTVGPGSTPATPSPVSNILLVVGAPGEPEFASNFVHQTQLWLSASQSQSIPITILGLDPDPEPSRAETSSSAATDRQRLEQELSRIPKTDPDPLWIILIGHGTFDGQEARFNLRGPDVTARELATWLRPFQRPVILINTASASAPFIPALSATNRIILTATRSGNELNATRFGRCLAEALTDPLSDLDQDGETSLLELFLTAAHRVSDFYLTEGRLLTEHALLDDNGDSRGTPAEWFRGLRATKAPEAGATLDGPRARQLHLFPTAADRALTPAQRELRHILELQIETLRGLKSSLAPDEYYRRLETILLELARLLHAAPQAEGEK